MLSLTINDDFAGGVRCDNWVGSLFGEGGRVELAIPPFFNLLGHNIDHCSCLCLVHCFNKILIEPFLFSTPQSFLTHSEILVTTMQR